MASSETNYTNIQRALAASGAVLAAGSVALSAYASHAFDGAAQGRLLIAAAFAFGHGLALAALASAASGWLAKIALLALAGGVLLFSGSLVMNVTAQWPTTMAPLGGQLLIVGWLLWAVHAWRR